MCTCLLLAGFANTVSADDKYLSPLVLTADKNGNNLYIAEFTAKQVAVFDLAAQKVIEVISLPDLPSGLALSTDQSHLYVTCLSAAGKVYVIELKDKRVIGSISAGHSPTAPVIRPDGRELYVCNQFDNNVSVIDLIEKKEVSRIPVVREPVAAAITPDGRSLFVANLLPAGPADRGYATAAVTVIDTTTHKVVVNLLLPNGSTSLRGICVAPDGRYVYVTHILSHYQLPTTQLERGWMNTNALSVIDVARLELLKTILLDDIDLGAANPWGVACTSDGRYVCVTHSGTHELSVIDQGALKEKLARESVKKDPNDLSVQSDVSSDLAFLTDLRRRVKVSGKGPRGLAIVGTKVYVVEYFTDSLGVVDMDPATGIEPKSLALGPTKDPTVVRRGEMLFHDASLCFQKWQSCVSCHPGPGRSDTLNWDLLSDGIGNPKNSKSLLFSHQTPPVMITGVRDSAETAVRSGIKHIQFAVRPETDAAAIDEYLKSLRPVTSPHLVNGKLSDSATRGREVFQKAGCASCHISPLYTDLKKYDVGTGKGMEKGRAFDTPTLVEVWRTAPYLHDGRAATIKEMLTRYNYDDMHGDTADLTKEEIEHLTEFVLSQ